MNLSKEELLVQLQKLKTEYDRKADILSKLQTTESEMLRENGILSLEKQEEYENTIKTLKEEIQNYKKDTQFLKDLVKRLSEQLNRYHEKQGLLPDDSYDEHLLDESRPDRRSIYKINSLLVAYDEVINEQNASLQLMRKQYESALERIRTLQKENEEAYKYIETLESEPATDGQISKVVVDAKLLMEERELLVKEVTMLQQRRRQIERNYEKQVEQLECLLRGAESKEKTFMHEIEKQNETIMMMQKDIEQLALLKRTSVREEEHRKAVEQCSNLLQKLKRVHQEETSHMKSKVQQIKLDQVSLVEKLSQSSKKFHVAKKDAVGYRTYIRSNHSKLQKQMEVIKTLRKSKKAVENKLRELVSILSNLIQDRKCLLQTLQQYKREAQKCSLEAQDRSATLGKLSQKMKEDHLRWSQKLAETEGKRLAAEEAWNRSVADTQRFRILLQKKDNEFKQIFNDFYHKPS